MKTAVAVFWSGWTVYLIVQSFRKTGEARIGYFLSACLTGLTAHLLVN